MTKVDKNRHVASIDRVERAAEKLHKALHGSVDVLLEAQAERVAGLSIRIYWAGRVVLTDHLSRLRNQLPPLLTVTDEPVARPVSSPRLRQRRLTRPEIHQLLAEYQSGDNMKLLATRWGLHRTTVAGHLRRAGVRLRRQGVSDADRAEAARLYGEGRSCLRLADRYDCAGETLRQALIQAGTQLRAPWERV